MTQSQFCQCGCGGSRVLAPVDSAALAVQNIIAPPAHLLADKRVRFGIAFAYAAIPLLATSDKLGVFLARVITQSNIAVIDDDGIAFDFQRMDVEGLFACPLWNESFLRMRSSIIFEKRQMITAARFKILWIVLAMLDPEIADDILSLQ